MKLLPITIGFLLGTAFLGSLAFTTYRDSSANSDFASYGCVENTNCYKK